MSSADEDDDDYSLSSSDEVVDLSALNGDQVLRYLVEANGDMLARGLTSPLLLAVDSGRLDAVRAACEREGCETRVRDGWTPLLWAVKNVGETGDGSLVPLVQFLLERGASVNAVNSTGHGCMAYAAKSGSVALARLLMRHGGSVSDLVQPKKMTPLHIAAAADQLEMVEMLLQAGADAEAKDSRGCTPLLFAARNASVAVIQELVDAGACVDHAGSNGRTALHEACFVGRTDNVRALVAAGAKSMTDSQGYTPLVDAVVEGHLECVKVLVEEAQVPLDEPLAGSGNTPIFMAVRHYDVFVYLMERGACLTTRNAIGKTLLERAEAGNAPDGVLEILRNSVKAD